MLVFHPTTITAAQYSRYLKCFFVSKQACYILFVPGRHHEPEQRVLLSIIGCPSGRIRALNEKKLKQDEDSSPSSPISGSEGGWVLRPFDGGRLILYSHWFTSMNCDISLWGICNFLRAETITAALRLSVLTVSTDEKRACERWRWGTEERKVGSEALGEPLDCKI